MIETKIALNPTAGARNAPHPKKPVPVISIEVTDNDGLELVEIATQLGEQSGSRAMVATSADTAINHAYIHSLAILHDEMLLERGDHVPKDGAGAISDIDDRDL